MLTNCYYVLCSNLAKSNSLAPTTETHHKIGVELLQKLQSYQDPFLCLSSQLTSAYSYPLLLETLSSLWQRTAVLGAVCFQFQSLSTTGKKKSTLLLEATVNRAMKEWPNLTLIQGGKSSQWIDYMSWSIQLRKVCAPGLKHTAGEQKPYPQRKAQGHC